MWLLKSENTKENIVWKVYIFGAKEFWIDNGPNKSPGYNVQIKL